MKSFIKAICGFSTCLALTTLGSPTLAQKSGLSRELATRVEKINELRKIYSLNAFDVSKNISRVKVAVLDKGFAGIYPAREDKRRYLPDDAEIVTDFIEAQKKSFLDPADFHGTDMAHIVWAMAGYSEAGPKFRLYNATTPEYFRLATEDLIQWGADIVVHSQNWETYGNFNGTAFVDEAVREVTDHGIIWLNAAGNYGKHVHNGVLDLRKNQHGGHLAFFQKSNNWFLRFRNLADENDVRITLSWDSFHPGWEQKGTENDIDLLLFLGDGKGGFTEKAIHRSRLKQVIKEIDNEKETIHAYEQIHVKKLKGYENRDYLVAISCEDEATAKKLLAQKIRYRVTILSTKQPFWDDKRSKQVNTIEFLDATEGGEIQTPGDSTGLTIGDVTSQSAEGPTRDGRIKPEILMAKNNIKFSTEKGRFGTSYANAIFAGIATVLKAAEPGLKQHHLLQFAQSDLKRFWEAEGWSAITNDAPSWAESEIIKWASAWLPNRAYIRKDAHRVMNMAVIGNFFDAISENEQNNRAKQNPDKYQHYLQLLRSFEHKEVKDPDRTKTEFGIVKEGYYRDKKVLKTRSVPVTKYEWRNSGRGIVGANGTYNLLTLVPVTRYADQQYWDYEREYVRAEYGDRTVTVPGRTRTELSPKVELKYRPISLDSTEPPWVTFGGTPQDFMRITQMDLSQTVIQLLSTHNKQKRFWSTPTPSVLKEATKQ
ncbi:MAG: S8 family serine peptidase [Deltaproteobacteria bacterium]|nr:S8 family serine peptidase [Deltaproteobacteria bacterium]